MSNNLKILLAVVLLITCSSILIDWPWWCFIIPVLILGSICSYKGLKASYFFMGFLAGSLVWLGMNSYYDLSYQGDALTKIALLMSVPKLLLILISGLIGGLITGLALYTGASIFSIRPVVNFDNM